MKIILPFLMFFGLGLALSGQSSAANLSDGLEQLNVLFMSDQFDEAQAELDRLASSLAKAAPASAGQLLFWRAKLEDIRGEFNAALQTLDQAEQQFRKAAISEAVYRTLAFKASILTKLGQFERADSLFDIAVRESNFSDRTNFAWALDYLGRQRVDQQQQVEADSLFALALNIFQSEFGKDAYPYAKVLYHLGESKLQQEAYEEAEKLLKEAGSTLTDILGAEHSELAYVWNYLGRIYSFTGDLPASEEALQKALDIRRNKLGDTHPLYAQVLVNFGKLFVDTGRFSEAEEALLEAKDIYLKAYGVTRSYAFVLDQLANLYEELGQQEKALSLYIQVKDILSEGSSIIEYATTINHLGYLYGSLGQTEQSIHAFEEGRSLLLKKGRQNSGVYGVLTAQLASGLADEGELEKAEPLLLEAKAIIADNYGEEHFWYATLVNNLALLYEYQEQFEASKTYYLEAEQIDKATLGEVHPDFVITLYNLARIYALTGDEAGALRYFREANQSQINLIYNYYSVFDEATRLSYLEEILLGFEEFFSFAVLYTGPDKSIYSDILNIDLAVKSLALDFSIDSRSVVRLANNPEVDSLYKQWTTIRRQLAQGYTFSEAEKAAEQIDLGQMEEAVELLEKQLVRRKDITASKLVNQQRATYQDIQSALGTKDAVIDYIRFQYLPPKDPTGKIVYAALISRSGQEYPQFVFLGEQKEIARVLQASVSIDGNNYVENTQIGYDLYQLIWQPLTPYLEGIEKINISAAGLIYKVSFAGLPVDQSGKELLHQQFREINYYGNLREFGAESVAPAAKQSVVLMGGALFDVADSELNQIASDIQEMRATQAAEEDRLLVFANKGEASRGKEEETEADRSAVEFNYLPGTAQEVKLIEQQLKRKDWKVDTYLGNQALEDNVKNLSGENAPNVLHIATHGYFFAPLKKDKASGASLQTSIASSKNPLIRSGLILTGANYSWKEGKRIDGLDDGILTAFEISNLDLSNTDLVVLSACETGLGDIYDAEGVFGLQRAFKTAGVDQLIISLWKVPDLQTQELMSLFYRYYLKTGNASNALFQAQQKMRKKYRPYYWAGFIAVR